MKFKCTSIAILILLFSIGCGSSGGGGDSDSPSGDSAPNILSLSLSQISVKSDNSDSSTITASVLDINNVPIEGVRVTFSSTGGQISASSVLTDADGEAKIIFKSGTVEKKNQTVNITASVADLDPKMIPVQITGTTVTLFTDNTNLEIDPNNPDKAKTSLIITVKDAVPLPIFDAPVTITVEPESTATAILVLPNGDTNGSILTGNTDVNGTLTVEVTGTGVGDLKIATEILGYTATQTYVVGAIGKIFSIIEPLEDVVRLSTGTPLTITVKAPDSGSEYNNVTFATTFGTWDGGTETVVTKSRDADNKVSAELSSANAGFATVQVYYTDEDGHLTKDSLTVAISAPSSEAAKIALQASSTVVAPRTGDISNTVTLWAKVRNGNDQVVGGTPVAFLIENPTGGGETISPAVVFTNEYGIAETTFTSGSLSSDAQGVILKASVVGKSDIDPASISIIIGGTASSVVIGQSSEIKSINEDTAYQLPMSVLVVDSNGNPVSNSQVTLGARPNRYATGYWIEIEKDVCMPSGSRAEIFNEDTNRNSIKDPGEDVNEDGELTPSHSAAGSVPAIVITDDNGVAQFDLIYLKSSAGWIEDSITASTVVYGTETQSTYTFWLPWMEKESCNLSDSPYGTISKVGSISIQAESGSIVADGTSSTLITATVKNSNGTNVEDGLIVTFTTTAGSLNADATPTIFTATTTNGVATATLTSSNNLGTATITATAGGISDTTTVSFVPGAAAINVTAEFDSINPEETTEIYADVYDASGYTISGVRIMFTLNDPVLAWIIDNTGITNSEGRATATLTAREIPGEVEITATTASLTNDPPKKIIILDQSAPSEINLTPTPESILVQGTSNVSAEVLDAEGNPVADGTTVIFEVENTLYGSISSTTNNGYATVTFEAVNQPGTAKIIASAGSASDSIDINIYQAPPAAIEFLSAEPHCIALQGTGGDDDSVIKFLVKDSNGTPLEGENVSFNMYGPNGGEYIDSTPGDFTPDEIDVSTDSNGIAQVILHSGNVAGPVTISATIVIHDVTNNTMTSRSSVVSIGGGVPSAKRFSISADILNLPGLEYNNKTADIIVALADRFGTYNVLKGTTVSFVAESGLAVDTSEITLEENGLATVSVRTQQPIYPNPKAPEDVDPYVWETDLQKYVLRNYSYDTNGHPRDGLCSILVYTNGEEHFDDRNTNGIYDMGESFVDTFEDPFCDYNDNGDYTDGDGTNDPEELYIEFANNGEWDDGNGVWDGQKYIFGNLPILITGSPVVKFYESNFNVTDGDSQPIHVLICDQNLNPLTPGSTVTISTDVGKLAGRTSHEYKNSNAVGPDQTGHLALIEYIFEVQDDDSGDSDPAETGAITVAVDWEGTTTTYQITGTVD